jgi:hypothetical protein
MPTYDYNHYNRHDVHYFEHINLDLQSSSLSFLEPEPQKRIIVGDPQHINRIEYV